MAGIDTPIPTLKLNDGTSMPMLAFGTGTAWYKTGDESKLDQAAIDSVKTAIKLGYTHLDGAEVYKTETELGLGIKESKVEREKLYVVTKALKGQDIENALKTSLKKLQLDNVDLYLIHSPFWAKTDEELQAAWAEMEKLKASGLTKSIGVSNFLPNHLKAILKTAKVPPVCNQIEFHPYLQHEELVSLHKQHNIATTAYGPLTAVTKAKPGPADDVLSQLARKYGVSEAEVSLRWCLDQGVVAITTSGKEQRLGDYLRCTKFQLTPKEVETISEVGKEKHFRGFWGNQFAADDRT